MHGWMLGCSWAGYPGLAGPFRISGGLFDALLLGSVYASSFICFFLRLSVLNHMVILPRTSADRAFCYYTHGVSCKPTSADEIR